MGNTARELVMKLMDDYDAAIAKKETAMLELAPLLEAREAALVPLRAAEASYKAAVDAYKAKEKELGLYELDVEIGRLSKQMPNNRKFPEPRNHNRLTASNGK